jgi:hypothetical protein
MPEVKTQDIYECCYYLLNGCELQSIGGLKVNGRLTCQVLFRGDKIHKLQLDYFTGKAAVNLFAFRRAYAQVNGYIQQAKRKLKQELNEQDQQAAAGPATVSESPGAGQGGVA